MYVIRPELRYEWKQVLTDKYGYDEDDAQQVVDFVAGKPAIAEAAPRSAEELNETLDAVEETLDELYLDSFGDADVHRKVRSDLMDAVEQYWELSDSAAVGNTGATAAVALHAKAEAQPSAHIEDWIDTIVEMIEDDSNPWSRDDLDELVEWVDSRIEE